MMGIRMAAAGLSRLEIGARSQSAGLTSLSIAVYDVHKTVNWHYICAAIHSKLVLASSEPVNGN